jgi:hypothetical protein
MGEFAVAIREYGPQLRLSREMKVIFLDYLRSLVGWTALKLVISQVFVQRIPPKTQEVTQPAGVH